MLYCYGTGPATQGPALQWQITPNTSPPKIPADRSSRNQEFKPLVLTKDSRPTVGGSWHCSTLEQRKQQPQWAFVAHTFQQTSLHKHVYSKSRYQSSGVDLGWKVGEPSVLFLDEPTSGLEPHLQLVGKCRCQSFLKGRFCWQATNCAGKDTGRDLISGRTTSIMRKKSSSYCQQSWISVASLYLQYYKLQ